MDRISQLHDELLLRILSLLPTTKDVVATMVLSKRWQFLWMSVPRLVYDDSCYTNIKHRRGYSQFVDRSLFLHEAPIIETLHFKLGQFHNTGDFRMWIKAADRRCVSKVIIQLEKSCSRNETPITLPRNLYTSFRMLVTLKLSNAVLVDGPISFPSLTKLSLVSMRYPGDDFVERLFSGSPLLQDLEMEQCSNDNLTILCVRMLHLKRLALHTSETRVMDDGHGFVIDAPSLECLDLVDHTDGFCVIENKMPKIVEAKLDSSCPHSEHLLSSVTSAKRVYLCLSTSKLAYPVGIVFNCLVHLKICTCETAWVNLLMRILTDTPKLQSLKLEQCHVLEDHQRPCWSEPSVVPECLLSSLEALEWVSYEGTEEEKEVAAFILRSGSCLKKVTIKPSSTSKGKKLRLIKELSLSPRRSPTCRLFFD